MRQSQNTRLMTQGPIWKQLVSFTIPLLIGNLFQQFYNTVDSIVVGNFVGTQALAAVGSTSMIINALIGFFLGLSTGAGVVISQYFGARDDKSLHDAIHTTMMLTLVSGLICTVLGVFSTNFMLRLMSTPDDVFASASEYLRIYFSGALGLMVYNMGSGMLRAVGDSKRPLYFLCVASLLNVVLDLLFVVAFGWGVAGVAYATITSQFISAALVVIVLMRANGGHKLILRDIRFHKRILGLVVKIGLPAGVQSAVTCFSNVVVQSYINKFGSACMAGWASYSRIDQFVLLPMSSLALTATTFVGQNIGAGDMERAHKGIKTALWISMGVTVVLTVLLNIFCEPFLHVFSQDQNVIYYGKLFINSLSWLYVFSCINQVLGGSLRGAGDSQSVMLIMLGSFVVFRQIYLYVGSLFIDSIYYVAFGYPAGWIVCSALMLLRFRFGHWREKANITKTA